MCIPSPAVLRLACGGAKGRATLLRLPSTVQRATADGLRGAAQIYRHILAGPLWQRRNGSDFAFFQSHTGFARGAAGGEYENMLCDDFAPALHFVNVRAQRYKCQARPGLCSHVWTSM